VGKGLPLSAVDRLQDGLDRMPPEATYVRIWTDEAARGGGGYRVDFVRDDDGDWLLKEWSSPSEECEL
jgi:hypothetical protein